MKKLKVVLTLLLALCCSLCMFACGGGEKNISEVVLEGQKLNFKEGEDFSVGDLKVSVYYQGDDELHELKADEYEVDSSAYNKAQAGQYLIYVIPKNQPAELTADGKDNRVKRSYYATVDHSWTESTDGAYQYECACGAKRNSYSGLEDKISTVAWGNPATLTRGGEGKTYPGVKDPIAGENHVSFGTLIAGQSLTLTLQITGLTRNDTPGAASAWDSPLMSIRNGADGVLPREDGWIIGQAAGYQVPAGCNIPVGGGAATVGIATADSPLWQVMTDGTSWSAGTAFPNDAANPTKWSTVVVEYIYQTDGVMLMRHTLQKYDGTETVYTISVNLPKAAYEVCAYGEFCDYTVTAVEFVAGLAIEDYDVTALPTNRVQPAGKLFNTEGLGTKATFSDKSTLDNNFNAYAYRYVKTVVKEPVEEGSKETKDVTYYDKTRVNLATEPLQADFFGFFVEFNGESRTITKPAKKIEEIGGADRITEEAYTADFLAGLQAQDSIKVIATPITGANATAIKVGEATFEAPEVAYDYTVTSNTDASAYIKLVATGTPAKATATQATALGGSTHFVAFKLLTNLKAEEVAETFEATANNVVVKATKAGNTVDVVLGLKADFEKTFNLNLNATTKVQIDLSGLAALPAAGAEITASDFTLDAGGTYTVEYTGLSGTIDNLTLATGNARATVAEVKAAIKGTYSATTTPDRENFYRASNTLYIVKVEAGTDKLTVQYWLAAPDLVNLTSERMSTEVSVRDGNTVLATANLVYNLKASSGAINIGTSEAPVYVTVSGNKLLVYAFTETTNIADGVNFAAFLNIEHPVEEVEKYQMSYNVGVSIKKGVATWLDENALTTGGSAAKIITVGTVNNTNDYDKGVILVASLDLTAIGVRAEDNTAKFRFTANEDTENGQTEYTVYTVTGNTIGKDSKTPSTERKELREGSCLVDGIQAYFEDNFYYGALIDPATGEHQWKAQQGSDTIDECEKCHSTRELLDNTVYAIVSSEGIAVAPSATPEEWWASAIGAVNVQGDFGVEYTFEHADGTGNYTNARLQIFDANEKYITIDLIATDDVVVDEAWANEGTKVEITKSFTKNGEAVTDKSQWMSHGGSNGEANGTDFVSLITRYGNTLLVRTSWTSPTGAKYVSTIKVTNVAYFDATLQINGWTAALKNVTRHTVTLSKYFGTIEKGGKKYDLSEGLISTPMLNTDYSGDWWNNGTDGASCVITDLEGDFIFTIEYDLVRDSFTDAVVQMVNHGADGTDTFGTFQVNGTQNDWAGDPISKDMTYTVKLNGKEVKTLPSVADGGFIGTHKITFIRIGDEITVYSEFTAKVGTKTESNVDDNGRTIHTGQKLPWTETKDIHYEIKYTGFAKTTDNMTIRLDGNPYWCDNFTRTFGYISEVTR